MYVVIVGGGGGGEFFFFFFFFFDVTKVFGVTDRTPEARHSFTHRSRKKCVWIATIVLTACFYLSGVKY